MAIRADYINSGPNLKEISDLFSMRRVKQQVQYYEINLKNSFLGVE